MPVCVTERERQTDRQIETERQRQRDRETETERGRDVLFTWTDRKKERKKERKRI